MRKFSILLLILLTACASLLPQPAATRISPALTIRTHPDGALYVGDLVSFEAYNPVAAQPLSNSLRISLAGKTLAEQPFSQFGMGARSQATFYWAWDTHALQPGDYILTFTLLPSGVHWDQKISLLPAAQLPAAQAGAHWVSVETACCTLHYITGTDAEKDLDALKRMLDAQAADVARRMGTQYKGKVPVTYLPRTLGHGGFTSDGIYVSYLHQNYAGGTAQQVTHHELVHWLDGQLGGNLRPSMLQEGLAVYMSDGHFKVEPIVPRAAALIDLNLYIPLRKLADTFYFSQHEASYAEAAALISYIISTYGQDGFNTFYRDIRPAKSGSQADALDAALQAHFGMNLDTFEAKFSAFLRQQPADAAARTDMRLTVAFYDTVRRYQREMDPSAYFLYTWLPDVATMRQRGIVADFLRHPDGLLNSQIENLLVSGDAALRAADYNGVESKINTVNLLLDLRSRFGG